MRTAREIRSNTRPWWLTGKKSIHEAVFDAFARIDNAQQYKRILNLRHMKLYGDYGAASLGGRGYTRRAGEGTELRYNVIQAAIDTAVAQLGTNKPRIQYLTDGGSKRMQDRAKRRSQFVNGCFYKYDQYPTSRRVLHDACIFGDGIQKTGVHFGRMFSERVFIDEYVVDDLEARYGAPANEFHHKEVSRHQLLEMFRHDAAACEIIKRAELSRDPFSDKTTLADSVSCIEAYHLGADANIGDAEDRDELAEDDESADEAVGKHVICLSSGTLFLEGWGCKSAFNKQRWMDRPLGSSGRGIAETLTGNQIEINYLLQKIQEHMTLAATQWWVQKNSKVAIRKMTNEAFAIGEYEGTKPEPMTVQSISAEYFTHLDRMIQYAFQIVGISQMTATQKKPQGIDSGVALQELNDQQSARFQNVLQSIEEFHVRQAEAFVDCARRLHESGHGMKVIAKGDRGSVRIDIKDVIMEESEYLVQAFPVAFLPSTPAGKLQRVKDLAGIFPQMQPYLMSLFGEMPDLQAAIEVVNSDYNDAMFCIEKIVDDGAQLIPESSQNLTLLVRLCQSSLLRFEHMEDIPEANLRNLRDYMVAADALNKEQMAKAQATQPAQAALPAPQGVPMPPGLPAAA
jgi:hypothetical protein